MSVSVIFSYYYNELLKTSLFKTEESDSFAPKALAIISFTGIAVSLGIYYYLKSGSLSTHQQNSSHHLSRLTPDTSSGSSFTLQPETEESMIDRALRRYYELKQPIRLTRLTSDISPSSPTYASARELERRLEEQGPFSLPPAMDRNATLINQAERINISWRPSDCRVFNSGPVSPRLFSSR